MIALRTTLRSSDDFAVRAEKIVYLLGLVGDPKILNQHVEVIAETLAQYSALDREAAGKADRVPWPSKERLMGRR